MQEGDKETEIGGGWKLIFIKEQWTDYFFKV